MANTHYKKIQHTFKKKRYKPGCDKDNIDYTLQIKENTIFIGSSFIK